MSEQWNTPLKEFITRYLTRVINSLTSIAETDVDDDVDDEWSDKIQYKATEKKQIRDILYPGVVKQVIAPDLLTTAGGFNPPAYRSRIYKKCLKILLILAITIVIVIIFMYTITPQNKNPFKIPHVVKKERYINNNDILKAMAGK